MVDTISRIRLRGRIPARRSNCHVDALSRGPVDSTIDQTHILDILEVREDDWIATVQSNDAEIRHIKETLEDAETAKTASIYKEYVVKKGRVFRVIDKSTTR